MFSHVQISVSHNALNCFKINTLGLHWKRDDQRTNSGTFICIGAILRHHSVKQRECLPCVRYKHFDVHVFNEVQERINHLEDSK